MFVPTEGKLETLDSADEYSIGLCDAVAAKYFRGDFAISE